MICKIIDGLQMEMNHLINNFITVVVINQLIFIFNAEPSKTEHCDYE